MTDKDVLIKISYIESEELLETFIKETRKIGLEPDEIIKKVLPSKPQRKLGNTTKDVKITVAGTPEQTEKIISEFLETVSKDLQLEPASRNEKLLTDN